MPVCKFCLKEGHSKFNCPKRPRSTLKANKPMNRVGRVQKRTQAAVNKWKKQQKPTHEGYYHCYICGRPIDYLMAEHVKSKARHPELRADLSNLKPTCSDCNENKGSKDN